MNCISDGIFVCSGRTHPPLTSRRGLLAAASRRPHGQPQPYTAAPEQPFPAARCQQYQPPRAIVTTHRLPLPSRHTTRSHVCCAIPATPATGSAAEVEEDLQDAQRGSGEPEPSRARSGAPRQGRRRDSRGNQQQQRRRQSQHQPDRSQGQDQALAQQEALLFIGFHPEELDIVRQQIPDLLLPYGADAEEAGGDGDAVPVVDVTCGLLSHTVPELLGRRTMTQGSVDIDGDSGAGAAEAAVAAGRVVLLVGPAAQGLGAALNDHLAEWGVVPALIAAYQPRHEGMPLAQLVTFLRAAHAEYFGLLQPVRVEPLTGGPDGAAAAAAAAAVGGAGHLDVLEDVRVVLTAAMDAGEVPSIHGHYRPDAGHIVVLDGLLTEGERRELLAWLTAAEHDHGGPPPEDKWEMSCVDREGDRATWGLQPHILQALRDDPPPPVVALQTRLAALYPEYDICHMPADQISDAAAAAAAAGGEEDEGTPLSSFVGNAVMAGDPCAWHADADPTTVPPYSPWVHNFGYYHNREVGRPLFVSVLLYLNQQWPEDYHAETLFLDPETQLGLFVRPAPGRVVLLEQDLPHRISAPSREAPGPRYSLVWKLVLAPKQGGTDAAPASQEEQVDGSDPRVSEEAPYQSICRPEWGEPVRIGSASGRSGVKAFQRRGGGVGGAAGRCV